MATTPTRTTVSTTAIEIARGPDTGVAPSRVLVKNVTGTGAVYLGTSSVTSGNGYKWDAADGPLGLDLEGGEVLYAIRDSADQTIHALTTGT